MGRLLYSAITSLDGYIADANGEFGWAEPDEEVHRAANDLIRPVGTHLYGRRLYDVMRVWETFPERPEDPAVLHEFAALWRPAEKVVYSRTLDAVHTANTRLERDFDPDVVRTLVAAAPHDVLVGGAALAAQAFGNGLVDEVSLFVTPVLVGGGTPALPDGIAQTTLALTEERRFGSGVVLLRYDVTRR
jgi:dihydrofolate reductase